ncbi:MAG: hypothetical protein LBI28_00030 [Treponema sp.]|jgi:Leucine-rich repeat (LRR) protein|nr:hypothetical protein [Treponema sp.]
MPDAKNSSEKLDLHWKNEAPDLGIASEGIFCKDMDDIINRISQVKDTVKEINLDNQSSFKEIPSILAECKQLEVLNISHTKVKEIPGFLSSLPALRTLSCCCNELSSFPLEIFNAEKLENLHLRINKEWTVPDSVPSMPNLKTLAFDIYSTVALPANLGSMKSLEELTFALKFEDGTAPELPDSFSKHPALKKMSVTDPFHKTEKTFNLEKAAKILSTCPNMESLRLSGVAVGDGHKNISTLKGLKELELRHLPITGNIFDSISGLSKLERLCLLGSQFKINEIPNIFMNMVDLQEFSFAGNMVVDIPPSIYNLSKLKILELGSTGISSIDEKIGGLQSLDKLHVYDNLLEKLPKAIFTLKNLSVLNIEENVFRPNELTAVSENLKALAANGQKIEFLCEGQGHRQMVKRLRSLKDTAVTDPSAYAKHCLNAVNENPHALKYVDTLKLSNTPYYPELCIAAVRKTCFALETIDPKSFGKGVYYRICMEAARSSEIGRVFKLIKTDLLTDSEYIQICIEAALHNHYPDFLNNFNTEEFKKRFSRDVYDHICWAAVLHYPPTVSKMINPTEAVRRLVEKSKAAPST